MDDDFSDPVDITAKLPDDFYKQLEEKKWQDRKAALEKLADLLDKNPKLEPKANYGELNETLLRVISKDSNVMLQAIAAKCLTGLASGLGAKYPFMRTSIPIVLEKFKEKKAAVADALAKAIDALAKTGSLEPCIEDIVSAFAKPSPNVRIQTALFLARYVLTQTQSTLNKKIVKAIVPPLVKLLSDSDGNCRKAAAEALGSITAVVGDKAATSLIGEQDALKMQSEFTTAYKEKRSSDTSSAPSTSTAPPSAQPTVVAANTAIVVDSTQSPPSQSSTTAETTVEEDEYEEIEVEVEVEVDDGAGAADISDDFSDPVDITAKLPDDFYKQLEEKKWQDRKEALEKLTDLLDKNPKLEPKANYGELNETLLRVISKDSNVMLQAIAAKCLTGLASGLGAKYPFMRTSIPIVLEKFKEKKAAVADALAKAIDALAKTGSLEPCIEDIVNAFAKPSPNVRIQTALFLARYVLTQTQSTLNKKIVKAIVPPLVKLLADSDANCRKAAAEALGSITAVVGDKAATSLIGEQDALKMQSIQAFVVSYKEKHAAKAGGKRIVKKMVKQRVLKAKKGGAKTTKAPAVQPSAAVEEDEYEEIEEEIEEEVDDGPGADADMDDFSDPVDITAKLPDDFYKQLEEKKWQDRKEALEKLADLLDKNPKLEPKANYGELNETLLRVISKDSNVMLQAIAAKCLTGLASGLGAKYAFTNTAIPVVLDKFKEKKVAVADALAKAIDALAKTGSLEPCIEDIVGAFAKPSPNVRIQTALFLARYVLTQTQSTLNKKIVKAIVPPLVKLLSDSDGNCRKAAAEALGSITAVVGDKAATSLIGEQDALKMQVVQEFTVTYKEKQSAKTGGKRIVKRIVKRRVLKAKKTVAPEADARTRTPSPGQSDAKTVKSATKKGATSRAQSSTRQTKALEPATDDDGEGFVVDTEQKAQRLKEEKAMKLLKWNFPSPQPEHVEQLKTQLQTICKPALYAMLFHADFKQHLKALDTLMQAIDTQQTACVNGSDLFLKWCTLRFFDTNPSVLIRSLDMCVALTDAMHRSEVKMSDIEAQSFVPYLLLKLGDSKETVRQNVRAILSLVTFLHPAGKVFPLVMEAMKSTKNTRQRAECLDQMALLIELYSIGATFKSLAAAVGDRDTNVRNGALNALVNVHMHVNDNEKFAKLCKDMREKERSLLNERIKRSANKPRPTIVAPPVVSTAGSVRGQRREREVSHERPQTNGGVKESDDVSPPKAKKGMFQLELDDVEPMGDPPYDITEAYELAKEPVRFPDLRTRGMLTQRERVAQMHSRGMTESQMSNASAFRAESSASMVSSQDASSIALDGVIGQIHSNTVQTAVQSMVQLSDILSDGTKVYLLSGKVDQVLTAVASQFNLLTNTHLHDDSIARGQVTKCYQSVVALILSVVGVDWLIREASENALKGVLGQLIAAMLVDQIKDLPNGQQVSSSLNLITIKIVDGGDPTNVLCALLRLLRESVASATAQSSYINLVMKCAWKQCRKMDALVNELRLASVILECHLFMQQFPTKTWRERGDDVPLRTIKTVINALCKSIGDSVLDYVTLVDNPPQSEAVAYMRKTLYDLSVKHALPGQIADDGSGDASAMPPNDADEKCRMGALLRKIADKENTRSGMMELYKLVREKPAMNIDSYLEKSTIFFRKYVNKQLDELREYNGVYPPNHGDRPTVIEPPNSDRSSSSMTTVLASIPSSSVHHAALAALEARAPHMPGYEQHKQRTADMVYTMPEVIENYRSLQELRKKMGLPLTNVKCVMPSDADHTGSLLGVEPLESPSKQPTSSQSMDALSASAKKERRRTNATFDALRARLDNVRRAGL